MEVINRKHEAIVLKGTSMISFKVFQVYFSKALVKDCKLEIGKYIHFLGEGKTWSFIQNDDPDGFKLQHDGDGISRGLIINSRSLVTYFSKKSGHKTPAQFYVIKSERDYAGKPLFEILADKPIAQIKENKS